jgi:hypothetical protein
VSDGCESSDRFRRRTGVTCSQRTKRGDDVFDLWASVNEKEPMAPDRTDPAPIDRDTMLIGLVAIGVRLYENPADAAPESTLAAERAVFGLQFDPVWRTLTNDDHRWLREKLDDEDDAFAHMVADYDERSVLIDEKDASER